MSNKFCPNLSSPESKALIEKLGLLGFYKEYIKNNYNIPNNINKPLASNGKISILYQKLLNLGITPKKAYNIYNNTKTEEFKRWFKGSKIVDENNEPLLVYHGTNSEFNNFKGYISYFTNDIEYAKKVKIANNIIVPAFLNIRNPKIYDSEIRLADVPDFAQTDKLISPAQNKINELLKGKDGIIGKDFGQFEGNTYVSFYPNQIKSIYNNGQFNNSSNDIYEDIADTTQSVQDKLFINRKLFSAKQEDDVINSIVYQIHTLRNEGINNTKTIFNTIFNRLKDEQEYFNQIKNDDVAQSLFKSYKNVVSNYNKFFEKASNRLLQQNIRITNLTEGTSNEESTYDDVTNLYQKLNYSDDSNFLQSSKDTASSNLKTILSLIPKYRYENGKVVLDEDGNFEEELNYLYLPTFENLDGIWNNLLYTLVDVPTGQKLNFLKESKNPKHNVIYNKIVTNSNLEVQNQFESVFSKQQAKFVTVSKEREDDYGSKSLKVFGTNRNDVDNLLINDWYNNFLQSDFVYTDKDGELVINTDKGKLLLEEYNSVIKVNDLNKMKNILNKIGINISAEALNQEFIYLEGSKITIKEILDSKLKYLFNRLSGNIQDVDIIEDQLEKNNPFITETSSLTALAKLENIVNPGLHEASFISGDDKAKYSFVNNSYLSIKFRKLKNDANYLKQLAKTSYASTSHYLTQLISNPTFNKTFELTYLDTIGNKATNQVNKPFSRMNSKEKEFTRVSLFQNQGSSTTAKGKHDISYFIGLIPSDKTTIPVIKTMNVDVVYGANGKFNNNTLDVVYNQFISEYERVKQTIKENADENNIPLAEYHGKNGSGSKFLVFDFLNEVLIDKDGLLLELDSTTVENLVKPKIEEFLQSLVSNQIQYWKNLNIYNKDLFDKGYKSKKGINIKQASKQNITAMPNAEKYNADLEAKYEPFLQKLAAEYAVNQFIFMMNQTQILSGDPALHGKSSIEKTWINYFKRMAKDIAPGLDGNFTDSHFNVLFLKDLDYSSVHLLEYQKKVFSDISSAYGKINPADAQEYTTLKEHLVVLDAYGRLNNKQKEAGKRLLEGGTNIEDIKLILQPQKPVYVEDVISGAINKMYYIKTSAFPLIPSLTKGLEIDKLRVVMENNDIARSVYESGVKLGLQGKISVVSNDGGDTFNELEIDTKQIITLPRTGFRIQQEIPYHGGDVTIGEATQGSKLILNNLLDDDKIQYNGEIISGNYAKEIFDNLHIEKINRSFDQLKNLLDFNNATGRFNNIDALSKILQEEAIDRNYPINDIYGIQVITDENGLRRFKVPISFTYSASKFESILNSLVTNRVIKGELPGFSKVQGSNVGFNKLVTLEQIENGIVKNAITWINPKDTKLNFITEKNGKLVGADILVPNYFKGVNILEYVKEDGTLDLERIPSELLTIIGMRIPTQGYSSMMKFTVKGFIPEIMGDLAIVPSEVVAQMGSDFDVDKLYFYNYHYLKDEQGNLTKITGDYNKLGKLSNKQIDNLIIQMFEDRLSDVRLLDQILEPNGFGKLPEISKEIQKLNKGQKFHPFTTQGQNNIHQLNADGKSGTGIFSLFSTSIRLFQDAKLSSQKFFLFKDSKGKTVKLQDFYSINNIEGGKRSNVIMYLQSASVDNSKEQLLGTLNINDTTMGIAGTMGLMGLPEDFIGYFLTQPIIKEYVNRVSNSNDIIDASYTKNISEETFNDLFFEYKGLDLESALLLKINTIYGVEDLKKENDNEFATKVLLDFYRFKSLADEIQAIQSTVNIGDKGLGTSLVSVQAKVKKVNKLFLKIEKPFYPIEGVNRILSLPLIAKSIQVLDQSKDMFSIIAPYSSKAYESVVDTILKESGMGETENNLKSIYDNIKSFILSSPDFIGEENIQDLRKELLYSKNNIAGRWLSYAKTAEGRKNILTQRIKPQLARKEGELNSLKSLNTPGSNTKSDIDTSIMYFYDMINSSNEVESKLAEDTVKYFILTGAQFGPTSIGKYISYDVLEKYNFSQKLRDFEDFLNNSNNDIQSFITQYFQNNPFKAHSYNIPLNTDEVLIDINNRNLITESGEVANYFVSYDKPSKTSFLYILQVTNKATQSYVYKKLEVLGDKLIKKYDYSKEGIFPLIDSYEQNDTLNLTDEEKLNQRYKYDSNDSKLVLENIVKNTTNIHYKNIANDLLKSNLDLNNITLSVDNEMLINGSYNNASNVIKINFKLVTTNEKFEEVFLHEMLHAPTVKLLNKFISLKQTLSNKDIVSQGLMTKEQVIAIEAIDNLLSEYRANHSDQANLNKYLEISSRRLNDKNSVTEEEIRFLTDNKREFYPLINIKEFVAAGLTSVTFINKLKQNNFWKKLNTIISKLLGLNSTDLDALYVNTIALANTSVNVSNNINNKKTINIYAGTGENAELSNFANRPFKLGDGIIYPTVEHAFQLEKLQYSNSYTNDQAEAIIKDMINKSASQIKAFGKTIKNLDVERWNQDASISMKIMIKSSFEQNPDVLNKLLATGNTQLTHIQDKGKWGKEFPKLLMEVRDELNINNDLLDNINLNDEDISSNQKKDLIDWLQLNNYITKKKFKDNYYIKKNFDSGQNGNSKYQENVNFLKEQAIKTGAINVIETANGYKITFNVLDSDIADGKAEKVIKTAEEIVIDRNIARMKDILKRNISLRKNLGTKSDPKLDLKIKALEDRIKKAESERSIINLITNVENTIKEIKNSIDSIKDTNTLEEYIKYLNDFSNLNDELEIDDNIIEGLDNRFNIAVAESNKLSNKLRNIAADLISGVHYKNLGYQIDLKSNLAQGLKEVGAREGNTLDASQSTSEIIQSIGNLIEKSQFDIDQRHAQFNKEFVPLVEAFNKKHKNYNILLQLDENGKPNGNLLGKYSDEYYKKAKGNFKFFKENTDLVISPEGKIQFEEDKKIAKEVSLNDEAYFDWLRNNDPNLYIEEFKSGFESSPELKYKASRYIKFNIKDKWIDSRYKELKDLGEDDPAVKFYNFIEPILRSLNNIHGQQSNYIPEIHKNMIDYFLQGKFQNGLRKVWDDLSPNMSATLDNKNEIIDDLTGKPRLYIPVRMFANKLQPSEKSYDLSAIIETIKYQQLGLDEKHDKEPLLNIYYNLIANSKEQLNKTDAQGNSIVVKNAPKRLLEQSEFIIQSFLYNKNQEDEGLIGVITDKIISYVRLKGMAFNLFSATGNIVQGLMSNYTFAAGSKEFTQTDYFKATGLMLNTIAGNKDIAKKISVLMNKLDVFVKANELNYGMSKEVKSASKKLGTNIDPFFMQNAGEYFIQGQTMVSILLNNKIKDKNGKDVSLFDAFDKDGNFILEDIQNPLENELDLFKYTMKIRKAIINIHGNYARPIMAKKHFYNRAIFIFRTWLPQAIETRFGDQKTDYLLNEKNKGRYRSYGFFGDKSGFIRNSEGKIDLNEIRQNLIWLIGLSGKTNLEQIDKTNMKKNLAELAMISAVTIMILMIKAGLKDLDDDERRYTTYILNSMIRAQSDLTFFMSPAAFNTIMRDPIPLMSVLKDTIDLQAAAFATIIGNGTYKTGSRKGKSKLLKELGDNFPIITQIDKNINYSNQVF